MSERIVYRRWAGSEIAAWVVIVLAVAVIAGLPRVFHKRIEAAATQRAVEQPDVQLLLTSRYAVGVNDLLNLKKAGKSDELLRALDRAAKDPQDQLRAAIVRGEVEGQGAAEETLKRLAASHPEVAPDVALLRRMYAGTVEPGSAEWSAFRERNGWFADLAASAGKPGTDALRAATMHAAVRTMATMAGMVLLAFGGAAVGLVLLIAGVFRWWRGLLAPAFGRRVRLPEDRRAYVQGFAMYLGGMIAFGIVIKYVLRLGGLWGAAALPLAFGVAVIWPLARGQKWSEWRGVLGLHGGAGFFREVGAGAVGYVAGLPVFAVGAVLTMALAKWTGIDASHPIVREVTSDPWRIAGLLLLASVWAPITEELMFRGALFGHLRERYGWWVSAGVVSLVFASIHPQGWVAVPALGSLAMVLAGIREWRGSIVGCMTAHAINNTLMLVGLVLMVG